MATIIDSNGTPTSESSALSVIDVTLDIRQNRMVSVLLKQYNKQSQQIKFTVTDNGEKIELKEIEHTVLFKMMTPDGRRISSYCAINENDHTAVLTVAKNYCSYPGKGTAELEVMNALEESQIGTMNLDVIIENSVYPDEMINGSSTYQGLDEKINAVREVCNSAIIVKEETESIRDETETIHDECVDLNNQTAQNTQLANDYANMAQSYANGESGAREGEETDNAKYYYNQTSLLKTDTETIKTELLEVQEVVNQKASAAESYATNASNSATEAENSASQTSIDRETVTALANEVNNKIGSPLTASTSSDMINQNKIYVYTGSEDGYTFGNWYYYDGSSWVSGGIYNSTAFETDSELIYAGQAADAKATGDKLSELKDDLTQLRKHGKNVFEGKMEQGYIDSTNGNPSSDYYDLFIRSKDFSDVREFNSEYICVSLLANINIVYIYQYDSKKAFIKREQKYIGKVLGDRKGTWTTLDANCSYVKILAQNSSGEKCTVNDVSDIQIENNYEATNYVYPYEGYDKTSRESIEKIETNISCIDSVVNPINGELGLLQKSCTSVPIILRGYGNMIASLKATRQDISTPSTTLTAFGKNLSKESHFDVSASYNGEMYITDWIVLEAGTKITISWNQNVSVTSATRNTPFWNGVDFGIVYLKREPIKESGKGSVSMVIPKTGSYIFGWASNSMSNPISITQFQVEIGDVATTFASCIKTTKEISFTSDIVNIGEFILENNYNYFYINSGLLTSECNKSIYDYANLSESPNYAYACGDIVCIGDSLTQGLYSPTEIGSIKQGYGYYLGRMLNANITLMGHSGGYPSAIYNSEVISHDFSNYDTLIIWLGTNGGLYYNDIDVDGKEANYYCKIIDKVKEQKEDIQIFIGTVFITGKINSMTEFATIEETNRTILEIAERYNIPVIDFSDLNQYSHRALHNMLDNTHFCKSGNIVIADRIMRFMDNWFKEDITRIEFGLLPKSSS